MDPSPTVKTLPNYLKIVCLAVCLTSLLACADSDRQQEKSGNTSANQSEIVAPEQIVSLQTARIHYANYSRRRVPLIQQYEDSILNSKGIDSAFAVTRYVSFDYKTLKAYLAYIEQEAGEVGADISSLRIYLANNPEEGPYVHPIQNSVFLLPAARPLNKGDQEFGLYIRGDAPGYLTGDLMPRKAPSGSGQDGNGPSEAAVLAFPPHPVQESQSLILNFGGSAPPPYN